MISRWVVKVKQERIGMKTPENILTYQQVHFVRPPVFLHSWLALSIKSADWYEVGREVVGGISCCPIPNTTSDLAKWTEQDSGGEQLFVEIFLLNRWLRGDLNNQIICTSLAVSQSGLNKNEPLN